MKDKKKKLLLGGVVILVLIIGAVLLFAKGCNSEKNGKDAKGGKTTQAGSNKKEAESGNGVVELGSDQNIEDITIKVADAPDFVEPGEDTLDIEKIQGFSAKKNNNTKKDKKNSSNKDDKKQETESDAASELKYQLSDINLVIESIGGYTGNYIEDGSDEPIKNVASMVVTNHSDKMLQVADIVFQVTKKKTAVFRVTNLLPGTSVLVLEANKREYKEKDDYSYGEVTAAYLDNPVLPKNTFDIEKEDGKLILVNKTDKTFKKVYVYYKYAQLGGAYMGGITYRVPFENVKGKEKVESIANHFSKSTSRVIDIQIAEEEEESK